MADSDPAVENNREPGARPRCPYLAGRPPHGSYHLWPSRVNVCYARPREEKPYGYVDKETQAARCFCGKEPFERCPDYERARADAIALPIFDGRNPEQLPASGAGEAGRQVRRRRVKRRHRHSPLQRWLKENGRTTLICAGWTLLALIALSLILRLM
jgi:hypothetical protein